MATTNFKIKNGLLSKRYLQSKSAISVSAVDDQTVGTMTSSILQTTGDNSSWVQKTADISSHGGKTVRPVYRYDMIVSDFKCDLQLDNIVIGGNTYNFTSDAQSWETTTQSKDIGDYSTANFVSIQTVSNLNGRVNRDSGGTPSTGTGATTDADGSGTGHYLYFETTSPANSASYNFLLRGPQITLPSSPTWTWFENRTGTSVGNLDAFLFISTQSATADLSQGSYFTLSLSGATALSFSNPPASGKAYSFALEITTSGDYAITWPDSIKWQGGSAPANTASGATDLYTFITIDGGTTYFGKKALTGVS